MKAAVLYGSTLPSIEQTPNGELFNFRNGTLEWRSGTFRGHDASDMLTVQLPFDFDPNATSSNFDRWVDEVFPEDSKEVVWEVLAYLLFNGNPLHKAFLFYGSGGNGKSTFLRLITAILGPENISNVTLRSLSEGRFEQAELVGKTANIVGDIDAKYLNDSSMFKAVTGEDRVQAQRKYGDPFSFTPWAVPVFSANEFWKSDDITEGYFRRWLVLPFVRNFTKAAEFDESKLHDEAPGIFNGALSRLPGLLARRNFSTSSSVTQAMNDFRDSSDSIGAWLRLDDSVSLDDSGWTVRGILRSKYENWCHENSKPAISVQKFHEQLAALGFAPLKRSNHGFKGIRIVEKG